MTWIPLTLSISACAPVEDTALDSAAGDLTEADTDGFEALAGLRFVQSSGLGVASYHFDAEDDIYIDYSAAPDDWALDDGSPLPTRKAFIETGYEGIRTFDAVIDWSTPEGSTSGGVQKWVYSMVFDEGYTAITSGTLEGYDSDGELMYILAFGEDMIYTRYE